MEKSIKELLQKLYETNSLEEQQLAYIIENITKEEKELLFAYADQTRQKYYEKNVYMRGLIEFSNFCARNCMYCGIRRDNDNVKRYRLTKEEILACCKEGYRLGYRTFVLQSGEDSYYTRERLVDIIKAIKETYADVAITISVGERSKETYQALYEAGADRYLLRHETASKDLYGAIHEDMSFENRRKCLKELKEIGFQVGAGFMVGLAGQTPEILAKDLVFLKELDPDMIGIGPFLPHHETPMREEKSGTIEQTLLMLALTRLMVPHVLLPATTAVGSLDPLGREKAIKAGANVVMPNLSPTNVRESYELYDGKICTGDEAAHCRGCIERRIIGSGYAVDMSTGHSYKSLHAV